jgi:hypothetical protein
LGAFFTPGRRCPPDQRSLSGRRLPFRNGQPYTPLKPPTGGAADNGAYEDSLAFTLPAFPLARDPWVEQEPFGSALGFAPYGYPQRTPGRGRPIGHWTGSHPHLYFKQAPIDVITHDVRHHVARLPSASTALLRQDGDGGLSPPLGYAAPRGARSHRAKFSSIHHDQLSSLG